MINLTTKQYKDIADFIKPIEGLSLVAYPDQKGVFTIGYGHTKNVKKGQIITEEEAENLLKNDIYDVISVINNSVSVPLTGNELIALSSFIFNIGETQFNSSTMLKLINKGDKQDAGLELSKWVYITKGGKKVVSKGLQNRRAIELAKWTEQYNVMETSTEAEENHKKIPLDIISVAAALPTTITDNTYVFIAALLIIACCIIYVRVKK